MSQLRRLRFLRAEKKMFTAHFHRIRVKQIKWPLDIQFEVQMWLEWELRGSHLRERLLRYLKKELSYSHFDLQRRVNDNDLYTLSDNDNLGDKWVSTRDVNGQKLFGSARPVSNFSPARPVPARENWKIRLFYYQVQKISVLVQGTLKVDD